MRVQKSSHKKTLFSSSEPHMYASIQLHCLDSHTKKSRFSSTHSHALLPVRQGHSVLRCCSARERRAWEWSLFWGLFRLLFFVLPGNSVRMLPAFRQGMRPFPGMHLSCALFLDRISTWWAREIVRRSLFFLVLFSPGTLLFGGRAYRWTWLCR